MRESDLFDEKTNQVVESYVSFMAPKARCLLKKKCDGAVICETCQRDHNARSRSQIKESLRIAVRTLEVYAPHLLKS